MKMAWRKKYTKVIVESDSMEAIELVLSTGVIENGDRQIIVSCKELLARPWEVELKHTFREANRVLDWVAKWAVSRGVEVLELNFLPQELVDI